MAAQTAAESGLSVRLIDSKPEDDIGDKACGNVVSTDDLDRVGIRHPKDICRVLKGVKVFSPDRKTVFTINLKHFVLDRRAFGQKLLSDAKRAGVEFSDRTKALAPLVENGKVVGIKTDKGEMLSKLVVDASGFQAVIRNKLPGVERVHGGDTGVCYLEIRELKKQIDPNYFLIYLKGVENGYCWVTPERKNRANIGIGVQGDSNHPSPKTLFYKHVFSWFNLENSKLIKTKGGIVPTREPINPLCSNGVMFVGDAGCQTNPVDAGGIGLSLAGGRIAGEVAADATEMGTDLKEYHRRYMNAYGNHQVALDAIRKFWREITDDDLNYLMHSGVIAKEDLEKMALGMGVELSALEKAKRFLKGICRPRLLRALLRATKGRSRRRKHEYGKMPKIKREVKTRPITRNLSLWST